MWKWRWTCHPVQAQPFLFHRFWTRRRVTKRRGWWGVCFVASLSEKDRHKSLMNDGWVPFLCFSFRVLALFMLAHYRNVILEWTDMTGLSGRRHVSLVDRLHLHLPQTFRDTPDYHRPHRQSPGPLSDTDSHPTPLRYINVRCTDSACYINIFWILKKYLHTVNFGTVWWKSSGYDSLNLVFIVFIYIYIYRHAFSIDMYV